jgi:L-ascorbate metabolism protein UlaG (beta-lactamase superfamily)
MPTLRFLGHAACEIRSADTRILIDPFLSGNPLAGAKAEELDPTAILVTHAHNDHIGDTVAIAKRSGALVVSQFEIAT